MHLQQNESGLNMGAEGVRRTFYSKRLCMSIGQFRKQSFFGTAVLIVSTAAAALLYSAVPPDPPKMFEQQFFVMGTTLTFTGYPADALFQNAVDAAFTEVERLNGVFSFHDKNSMLSRVNRSGRTGSVVTDEFIQVLERARTLWKLTDGAFDPTVGPLMRLWKLDDLQGSVPADEQILMTLVMVGMDKVKVEDRKVILTRAGMALDLGACVKGYAVDRATAVMRGRGLNNFMVNLGGNIYASGVRPDGMPWKIGLRDPRDGSAISGVIQLSNEGVATSGDYERMFVRNGKRYCHIVNPKTGYPVESMATVTAIARDAFTADLFSTSCFLLGPDRPLLDADLFGVLYGKCADAGGRRIVYSMTSDFKERLLENKFDNTDPPPEP
jgi:thiamine biosynthesis lipoprotein